MLSIPAGWLVMVDNLGFMDESITEDLDEGYGGDDLRWTRGEDEEGEHETSTTDTRATNAQHRTSISSSSSSFCFSSSFRSTLHLAQETGGRWDGAMAASRQPNSTSSWQALINGGLHRMQTREDNSSSTSILPQPYQLPTRNISAHQGEPPPCQPWLSLRRVSTEVRT